MNEYKDTANEPSKTKRYFCYDVVLVIPCSTPYEGTDRADYIEARTPEEAAETYAQIYDIKTGEKPRKHRTIRVRLASRYDEAFQEIKVNVRWIPLYNAEK